MKLDYVDQIDDRDLTVTVASMVLGVGILTLPRMIAEHTAGGDGLFSIMIAGVIVLLVGWTLARLASRFPQQQFFEYTSAIITKPLAIALSICISLHYILVTSYLVRVQADISKLYLLERTPLEVIALVFFLVIIYGVSGSRISLLRINMMFLPIVLTVTLLVQLMNLGFFRLENLEPLFVTPWKNIFKGASNAAQSFLGFEIVLFYIALMKNPAKASKATVRGVSITIFLYLVIYIFTLGVISNSGTSNVIYPTIELALEVEVPGEFFERFESIFLTIWIMTLFNTTAMAFDVVLILWNSIFQNVNKFTFVLIFSPIIYLISMFPQEYIGVNQLGRYAGMSGIILVVFIPIIVFWIAKIRGVKGNG